MDSKCKGGVPNHINIATSVTVALQWAYMLNGNTSPATIPFFIPFPWHVWNAP
jgi:hypothetical protein